MLDERATTIRKYFQLLYDGAPTECWSTLGLFKSKSVGYEVFSLSEIGKAVKWVLMASDPDALNGQAEVYTRILPIRPDRRPTRGKRGGEKDSAGTTVLWAELDLNKTKRNREEVLKAVRSFEPKPTAIVFSGGGYHVYWKLQQFETDLYAIKQRTLGLTQKLKEYGADDCYDLARILRVPGTWNLKYQEPIYADFVEYHPERVYTLGDFPTVEYKEKELDLDFDEEPLPDDFLEQIKKKDGALYKRITTGEGAPANEAGTRIDRSDNDWYIVMRLLELGYSRGQCLAVLTNPEWFASSKTLRRRGPKGELVPDWDYAKYTIANAWTAYQKQEEENKLSPWRFFDSESGGFVPAWLAEEILQEEHFLTVGDTLYHYEDGVFVKHGENFLRALIVEKLQDKWRPAYSSGVVQYIKDKTYYDPSTEVRKTEPVLVNVRNGMLEVGANQVELLPHSPEYRSFAQLPVEYNPEADPTLVHQFLKQVFLDDQIPVFEEFLGTCLIPDYRTKKAALFVGRSDSGKSTLIRFVEALIGEKNRSNRTLQDLAGGNRFAKASVFGKLLNAYADLPETLVYDIGQFKALTGDDSVDAEYKGRDAFSFRNYAKLLFSANTYPQVRSPDEAFFNRWIVFKFPSWFVDDESQVDESRRVFKKDTALEGRLKTPENLSALLNLAIAGLQRYLRNGKFSESESIKRGLEEFIARSDSVVAFFEACSEIDPNAKEPKDTVYSTYQLWCSEVGIEALNPNRFFRRLKEPQVRGRLQIRELINTTIEGMPPDKQFNVIAGRRFKSFATVTSPTSVRVEIPQPE